MSPSMVHESFHGKLGLLLLEEVMGGNNESSMLGRSACTAALAALSQIETADADACSQIVLGLSEVRLHASM